MIGQVQFLENHLQGTVPHFPIPGSQQIKHQIAVVQKGRQVLVRFDDLHCRRTTDDELIPEGMRVIGNIDLYFGKMRP
jgi:hypothetical protein